MKTRRRLTIASVAFLLLLAAVIPYHFFLYKTLTSGDLVVAKGSIVTYTLLDDSRGMHQYLIHLSGYKATFQIPADFAQYFAKTRFQSDLKNGDSLSLWIPVASTEKLVSNGTIPVFAVRTASATYLDERPTLEAYDNKNNPRKQAPVWTSWVPFIAAASIILLIVLAYVIWIIARAISARPRKPKTLSDPQALHESSQRLKKLLTKGASEQKQLSMEEQKLLTNGDSEQELAVTGDSEQKPDDPPQS